MYLITRDGTKIVRTLERILGTCTIAEDSVVRTEAGNLGFDYDGSGTDVDWDSQESVPGKYLLDEDGDEYSEADCALCDDDDLELVQAAIKLSEGELA